MKPQIPFEDWEKCDLRVGKIVKVEDHSKADKLYVLEVEFGEEIGKRTIVAGLKKHYQKEELEGKRIIVLNIPDLYGRGDGNLIKILVSKLREFGIIAS